VENLSKLLPAVPSLGHHLQILTAYEIEIHAQTLIEIILVVIGRPLGRQVVTGNPTPMVITAIFEFTANAGKVMATIISTATIMGFFSGLFPPKNSLAQPHI
jgi:hypothetical protein